MTGGITASERALTKLARKSFLDLWSYPNPFIDKRMNGGRSVGKELCDLLVVCGDDVLVFSDKSIGWPSGCDTSLAWSRWFRRAISNSADQIKGAERWIRNFPNRIFADRSCQTKLPVAFPPSDKLRFHGVVVARGAGAACKQHFGEGSGSLIIHSFDAAHPEHGGEFTAKMPFSVGDIGAPGSYIHVLDDTTLSVILRELDTISDFVEYLIKKSEFLRSGVSISAHGEEELLALYIRSSSNARNFDLGEYPTDGSATLLLEGGHYAKLRLQKDYIFRKKAAKISYAWDRMIDRTVRDIRSDNLEDIVGLERSLSLLDYEQGLRYMALQNRRDRSFLAASLSDIIHNIGDDNRYFRLATPSTNFLDSKTAFGLFLLRNDNNTNPSRDLRSYRLLRAQNLFAYCINLLIDYPDIDRIVGIGLEPPRKRGADRNSTSQDTLFVERDGDFAPEVIQGARALRDEYGILKPEKVRAKVAVPKVSKPVLNTLASFENPISYSFKPLLGLGSGNRAERRATQSRDRRRRD